MEDEERVKKKIEQELEKVKYRIEILDLIEEKLSKMKILAQITLYE